MSALTQHTTNMKQQQQQQQQRSFNGPLSETICMSWHQKNSIRSLQFLHSVFVVTILSIASSLHSFMSGNLSVMRHQHTLHKCGPLTGWGKGRNITSARWQVTLCIPYGM